MKTFQIELPKMFGDHHVIAVRKILLELPGIDEVYASSSFQTLQLSYDQEKLSEEEILAKLEETGYLGEMQTPQESNLPASENGDKKDFRHTAAFENTRQVSFHRDLAFKGRALWPCPGMGVITKEKVED
jgi:copper chaperone CopZ